MLAKFFEELYGLDEDDAKRITNLIQYVYYKRPIPEKEKKVWVERKVYDESDNKVFIFPFYNSEGIIHPCMMFFLLLVWYDLIDYGKLIGIEEGERK